MANSMNAKSLRLARDTLKDTLMTLDKELEVKVARVYAPDTEAANRTMARILFECYATNLAHFSGHQDMGTVTIIGVLLHIDASTCL